VLFSIVVYAPLAHATWHPDGLLHKWGVLDFAGGTVVHVSAGVAALAGARFFGKREDHDRPHEPANIPLVVLGTGMLWFGWFGFNAGSALAADATAISAFLATNTASAAAAVAWLLCDVIQGKKPSALGACVGAVVGLVAITPAAGYVGVGSSIAIGAIGSVVSSVAVRIKTRTGLDDTLDVFPCHGVGGLTGMLLTAVFAEKVGLVHGSTKLFTVHLGAMLIVVPVTYLLSSALYRVVDAIIPLRVSPTEELLGLDLSQHGETIYEADDEGLRTPSASPARARAHDTTSASQHTAPSEPATALEG
jgi:Amt family ammonium transporter